ncbi:MAG: hypothetical protein D3M94_03755 [Rhodocyclales bacterium GT-UBC]|nr:MAG: hypothetical protein D3M94_03755 [Rhodocyclales bacterium GT-UBC]
MARQPRRKQEQLSFPELALYDQPVINPAMALVDISLAAPQTLRESPAMSVSALPESETPRVARKRPGRPKIVLVKDLPVQPVELSAAAEPGQHEQAVAVSSTEYAQSANDMPEIGGKPSVPGDPPAVASCPGVASAATADVAPHGDAGPTRLVERAIDSASQSISASGQRPGLQFWTQASSLIASLVFVVVLVIGAAQFVETERRQRDLLVAQKEVLLQERNLKVVEMHARATDLFLRYNDLVQQVSAPLPKGAKKELRYWKENLALSLLASLFDLTRGNREWEASIALAVERHGRLVREQRLSCIGYSRDFVRLLEQVFGVREAMLCKIPVAD